MNREIKFRAWDKKGTRMILPEFLFGLLMSCDPSTIKHYELMQFTGLKDKNGKEIYEGDFINFYWPDYSAHFEAREVFYHVDAFCVKRDKDILLLGDVTQHEVVGNIYENPDLLKP